MPVCVLVIDDNPINLKLASDILTMEGYEVKQATNAESALTIIHAQLPGLILMDIELPGIDGLTFTKMLKGTSMTSHIPIVAITAFAMKGDEEKALQAGCNGYITKPIDTRKFPLQIKKFLQRTDMNVK